MGEEKRLSWLSRYFPEANYVETLFSSQSPAPATSHHQPYHDPLYLSRRKISHTSRIWLHFIMSGPNLCCVRTAQFTAYAKWRWTRGLRKVYPPCAQRLSCLRALWATRAKMYTHIFQRSEQPGLYIRVYATFPDVFQRVEEIKVEIKEDYEIKSSSIGKNRRIFIHLSCWAYEEESNRDWSPAAR
jgi:hypothetical protein